jgi:tetratricopeptide (TPR) repeat protein
VVQGEYSQAISFSQQALKIAQQIGEEWTIIVCLNNLGEAYCGSAKYDLAMDYFVKAIRIAWDIEAVDSVARFTVNAGRCRQLQGCRQEALDLIQAALAHSATEHDAREKAVRWLTEMKSDTCVDNDDPRLEAAITRIIL